MSTPKQNSFDALFERHMKVGNALDFKRKYRTLYTQVIRPIEAERDAFSNEVMKQRETIKELQDALVSAREFILKQSASTDAADAYEKVSKALSQSVTK